MFKQESKILNYIYFNVRSHVLHTVLLFSIYTCRKDAFVKRFIGLELGYLKLLD